jgi:asparagine synthase (glutamine-hydrolysing)
LFAGALAVTNGGGKVLDAVVERAPQAFSVFGPAELEGSERTEWSFLYERRRFATLHDRDARVPLRSPQRDDHVAFWGRIDNREELARALGLGGGEREVSDGALIGLAWERWGRDMVARLAGDFAVAVVQPRRRRVFLARDPIGTKPLYYRCDAAGIAFASSASALKLDGFPLSADPGWMARYLWMDTSVDARRTAYREISKLPAGHLLEAGESTRPHVERWHGWRDDPPEAARRDARWTEAYREGLEEAVACRLATAEPIGIETTGGIDSAAIVALAARRLGTPCDRLRTFGFAWSQDEPARILATSQAYGIRHNHIVTSREAPTPATLERAIAAIGYPEEHSNASGHALLYEEAEHHGIRAMLSGFGGDEAVSNGGGLARHELAAAGNLAALAGTFEGPAVLKPLRMARFLALRRRRGNGFLDTWRERWRHRLLSDEAIADHGIAQDYFASARGDGDFERVNQSVLDRLDRMVHATRLENCTLVGAAWGIDYRWPLWDVRLVQQYLSTPAIEKMGPHGIGRYLHRRAIADIVPAEVCWKQSKYMGPAVSPRDRVLDAPIWGSARELRDAIPGEVQALLDPARLDAGLKLMASGSGSAEARIAVRSTLVSLHWLSRWRAQDARGGGQAALP